MQEFFVPIITNDTLGESVEKLFSVYVKKSGHTVSIFSNDEVEFLDKKIKDVFSSDSFYFDIKEVRCDSQTVKFTKFTDYTKSISLGLLCSAYGLVKKLQIKTKFDSITLTGDFEVINDKVIFKTVNGIKDKFNAVQNYAEQHILENHLFVYVSKTEEIPEGIYNNIITVFHLSTESSFEELTSEIFEIASDDSRKELLDTFIYNSPSFFVETKNFMQIRHAYFSSFDRYFVLNGKGESGKTAIMYNLMRDNLVLDSNIIPVWIMINNELLSDSFIVDRNNKTEKKGKVYNYLLNFLPEKITEKKIILCVDNLEIDKACEIINNLRTISEERELDAKIIITSRHSIKRNNLENSIFQYELKELSKSEINAFTWQISGKQPYSNDFLDSLHENLKKEPGLICSVLSLIESGKIDTETTRRELKVIAREKSETVFQMVISNLSLDKQIILFALIGLGFKNQAITIENIRESINKNRDNLKNVCNIDEFFDEKFYIDTLCALVKYNIVINVKDSYSFISIPQTFFVLSNFSEKENKLRDIFVAYEYRLFVAIVNNKTRKLEELLNQYNGSFEDLLHLELKAISISSNKKVISILLSKAFEYIAKGNIKDITDKDSSEFKTTAFYLNSKIPLIDLITAAQNCDSDSEDYFTMDTFRSELIELNKDYVIYGNVYDFLMGMYPRYFKFYINGDEINQNKARIKNYMYSKKHLGFVTKWKSSERYGFIFYDNQDSIFFDSKSFEKSENISEMKRGSLVSYYLIPNDYYDPLKPSKTPCKYKVNERTLSIVGYESDYEVGIKKVLNINRSERNK